MIHIDLNPSISCDNNYDNINTNIEVHTMYYLNPFISFENY